MPGQAHTLRAPKSRRAGIGRPVLAAATSAAVLAIVLAFYVTATPWINLWRADRLLSQAYSENRPFAFRLPDLGYSRVRATTGRRPLTIREADALLDKTRARPRDQARMHSLRGREFFLEQEPDDAIQEYRRALEIDPRDSRTRMELAGAFLLRARQQNRAVDIALALEQAGTSTGLHAKSAVDHFNLALAYEAIPAPHLALDEWTLAASAEPDENWRREAEEHRDHFKALLSGLRQRSEALEGGPEAFLREDKRQPYPPEFALDTALAYWMPQRRTAAPSREALTLLASRFIERHQDPWLTELLRVPETAPGGAAIQALADAVQDNQAGEHEAALQRAMVAEKEFRALGNRAGALRARLENIYALQRAQQAADCIHPAQSLYRELAGTPYFLLRPQSWLELTSCELREHDESRAISEREAALKWIAATGYEGVELRALGSLVEPELIRANPVRLWRIVNEGLGRFWAGEFSPVRAEQFYFGAALSMRGGSFPFSGVVMAREGVRVIERVPNQQWRGLVVGGLGLMEMDAGLTADAAATFRDAEGIFAKCKPTKTLARYEIFNSMERAGAECLREDPLKIIPRLQTLEQSVSPATWPEGYVSLEQSLGIAYLRAGALAKAVNAFRAVIDHARRILDGSSDQGQRDAFIRIVDYTYREDAQVKLVRDRDPAAAFESLETFRAARLPGPRPASMRSLVPSGAMLLDVAFMPSGVAVFAADHTGLEARWNPGIQPALESWARQFTAVCGSSETSAEEMERVSRPIYNLLVAPFEGRLATNQILVIHADGPLQNMPWAALRDARGRTLLERLPVVIGSALREQRAPVSGPASPKRLLIVTNPAISADLAKAFPPLSGSLAQGRRIQSYFPGARLLSGADATVDAVKELLPQFTFFHFGGHGLTDGGYGAMLLASRAGQSYGGVLGAPEMAGMDLRGVELVSLAACSIGVGQAAGPVNPESLVRALLDAGARNVIAASWEIESQSAGEIFTDFYGRLARGQSVAAALRTACLRIRSKPATAHPYYWAGFQLYGASDQLQREL